MRERGALGAPSVQLALPRGRRCLRCDAPELEFEPDAQAPDSEGEPIAPDQSLPGEQPRPDQTLPPSSEKVDEAT